MEATGAALLFPKEFTETILKEPHAISNPLMTAF